LSLLTIVQKTCRRIGISRPSAVVSSTDAQVQQLFELANEEGLSLARRGDWQAMTSEHTFITVGQAEQTNTPIPSDLDHFLPDTFFNRTQQRKLNGPITPQEWQAYQAFPALSQIWLAFREREGSFLITSTSAPTGRAPRQASGSWSSPPTTTPPTWTKN
jgi:hypothetical protein